MTYIIMTTRTDDDDYDGVVVLISKTPTNTHLTVLSPSIFLSIFLPLPPSHYNVSEGIPASTATASATSATSTASTATGRINLIFG
jgi:hypothetical protein